jgi:hypothetical protein
MFLNPIGHKYRWRNYAQPKDKFKDYLKTLCLRNALFYGNISQNAEFKIVFEMDCCRA